MAAMRGLVALAFALGVGLGAPSRTEGTTRSAVRNLPGCRPLRLDAGYVAGVRQALASGRDIPGAALLKSPGGATYAGVARYLKPLMLAGHPPGNRQMSLTASGVYYLPFGLPNAAGGATTIALHVADGSQIISNRADDRDRLTVYVGVDGRERYGSCLARLAVPQLYRGYLPILETSYTDATGTTYRQESFVAWSPTMQSPLSFVRVSIEPRSVHPSPARVRFELATSGLSLQGDSVVGAGKTYLFAGEGATFDGRALTYSVDGRAPRTVYIARPIRPTQGEPMLLDRTSYEQARRSVIDYWTGRLSEGTVFIVPERRVLDAERNLLIQNLEMTWRYSLGNAYQEFEFPESLDAADVLGEYGHTDVEKAIIETALRQPLAPKLYPNWQMGAELLSCARYYGLTHDAAFLAHVTPLLRGYLARLARQLGANPLRLLDRERYASDLPNSVYGLDNQAIVLQSLRAIAEAWWAGDDPRESAQARSLAASLAAGLRAVTQKSERRLPDGSLFVPVALLAPGAPFDHVTASKAGSYWNLVVPYALASGLFEPHGAEAAGILRYLLSHGSRFLGLVRADAASLYDNPVFPTSGSDEVYGLDVARFFADNDQPDQLVLSLYGQLAAGMTRGTFVSGESATIAPVPGEYYRSMYLPPNSVSNATFLEKLRLMLIHETASGEGRPQGLELAYATPRSWLAPGNSIVVHSAPTCFGPLSFSITAAKGVVRASVDVPTEQHPRFLHLRLRLPLGAQIAGVALNGRPYSRVDRRTATLDLSGRTGTITLTVQTTQGFKPTAS
jgi:hypothetical protein